MKHHSRTLLRYVSILILVLLALAGITGSQQARPAAAMMPAGGDSSAVAAPANNPAAAQTGGTGNAAGAAQANNPAAQTGGNGVTFKPGGVPVIQIPPSAPGSSTGNPGTASVAVSSDHVYQIDLGKVGAQPQPDLARAQSAAKQPDQPVPAGGIVGSDNAFMSISPDTARPNVQAAIAVVVSGFQPREIVIFSFSGGNLFWAQANADGAVSAVVTTGGGSGYVWVQAAGLYSGHVAGGAFQINQYAAQVPGLAIAPHAVRNGDHLYMVGVRYPASSNLTIQRNGTALAGSYAVGQQGYNQDMFVLTVSAAQNGAAVYSAYPQSPANPVGNLAGQSVEERSDAGPIAPQGDRNTARAFVDRPVLSDTVATTAGLAGEGFQPGETVNFVRQPGNALGSATADASGAVLIAVAVPAGVNAYSLSLTGASSGRVGYGALLVDNRAYNVPSAIIAPSHSTSATSPGTVSVLFTRFTPNLTNTAFLIDGQVQGSITTDAQGVASASNINQPVNWPLVHAYTFSETFGLNVSTAGLVLPNTGMVLGTVTDAVTGLPIRATIRPDGQLISAVQSDPTNNGSYQVPFTAGTRTLVVSAGGCYQDQNVPVTVVRNTVVTKNIAMQRSGIDNVGYSCYQNAQRAYVPAANRVLSNNFLEEISNYSMPFSINFYNNQVYTGTISSNGFATLGTQFTCSNPNSCWPDNSGLPNNSVPHDMLAPMWDDLSGMSTSDPSSGVFTGVIGTAPNRTFLIEWRNFKHNNDTVNITNTVQIQIDEADSSVYFLYPSFNVGRSDGREATIGTNSANGQTGKIQQINGCNTAYGDCEWQNYVWPGDSVRFYKSQNPTATPTATNTGTPTNTATPATPTNTWTPTAEACRSDGNYSLNIATAVPIVPGTTDIGNHGDNVITAINLPFTYTYYGQQFTTANVSSNGNLQFSSNYSNDGSNTCLANGNFNNTIFAYWDDLRTDGASGAAGVFTSISGTAPNRIFNIEWRTCIWTAAACSSVDTQFEVRLYESQQKLDVIYGNVAQNGRFATSGVQKGTGQLVRVYSCDNLMLIPGVQLDYMQIPCATPTITLTPTITRTPTNTATPTLIPTLPRSATSTPVLVCNGGTISFSSVMNSSKVVPANNSPATGVGYFSLTSNNTMNYNISYQNLVAAATAVEIHDGAQGTNGALIYSIPLASLPIIGSFAFPPAYLADLNAGNVYVVVSSSAFPSGEIRDQLHSLCSGTAVPTDTPCAITFTDVPAGAYFYDPVQYLYCRGIISGYADNTFRPYNNTTRGQMTKIIALGFTVATYTPPAGGYTFADVLPNSTFFVNIESAARANIVGGYPCGHTGEPCDSNSRPYFRPGTNVSRGQLTKITAIAAGWALINPTNATFEDVAPGSTFYQYIETSVCRAVLNGYACGGAGEPCDSGNRPYFRPSRSALRGQISKIVYNAISPPQTCVVP